MHTGKTTLQNSTYDDRKLYNEKNRMDSMYSETKIRDSYDDETKKIRDTYDDMKNRESYGDVKAPYHHNNNGTLDHNPLPAYTAHPDTHLDNHILQRNSLDMDNPGDRNSALNLVEDKYRESKHSNYDRVEDEIHDVMDNPTFTKEENYD